MQHTDNVTLINDVTLMMGVGGGEMLAFHDVTLMMGVWGGGNC